MLASFLMLFMLCFMIVYVCLPLFDCTSLSNRYRSSINLLKGDLGDSRDPLSVPRACYVYMSGMATVLVQALVQRLVHASVHVCCAGARA